MRSAIDTNVISALWSGGRDSANAEKLLMRSHSRGGLVICGIVYAELTAHPGVTEGFVDGFLHDAGITVDTGLNIDIWREAGVRFARYSSRRLKAKAGAPRRLLADFVIGSHALLSAECLITFNTADFKLDFPELALADLSSR